MRESEIDMRLSMTILSASMVAIVVGPLPALAADDIDAVVAELEQSGGANSAVFEEQLRAHLGNGGTVCGGEEGCQQRLRQEVRACHRLAQKNGQLASEEDGAHVAAAVMTMAGDGGDVEQAGKLVRAQLENKWQPKQIGELAQQTQQMRNRWRHQAMRLVAECTGNGACMPDEAAAAVRTMKKASQRADQDARRVARRVRAAIAGHGKKRSGNGEALQNRMRKRLRLKGEGGTESTVGQGEQYRHRYRYHVDGEGRRGGQFGGGESSGQGVGAGQGQKPGPRRGR